MALGMTSRDATAARTETLGAAQSLLARLAADLHGTGMMRSAGLDQTRAVQAGADKTLANIDAVHGMNPAQPAPGQQAPMSQTAPSHVLAQAREAAIGAGAFVRKVDSVLEQNDATKWRDAIEAKPKGTGGPER